MILEKIAEAAKERVAECKKQKSLATVRSDAEQLPRGKDFLSALQAPGLSVIAELKKASPSKGLISPDFEQIFLDKARAYEAGGAAAISCLTEPFFFQGGDKFLMQARAAVELPILRKDFTVDEYQIYEAKTIGADAVLLICSILSQNQLQEYLAQVKELELAALVEAHTAEEVEMAIKVGAEIIGVNNRNLKNFSVNPTNSLRLRDMVPQDKIFVAESGIKEAADTVALKQTGVNAVLIGETLMRASDPAKLLQEIRG